MQHLMIATGVEQEGRRLEAIIPLRGDVETPRVICLHQDHQQKQQQQVVQDGQIDGSIINYGLFNFIHVCGAKLDVDSTNYLSLIRL